MHALAYLTVAGILFWVVLANLAPRLTAVLLIGGGVGLVLAAVFARKLRNPDSEDL